MQKFVLGSVKNNDGEVESDRDDERSGQRQM